MSSIHPVIHLNKAYKDSELVFVKLSKADVNSTVKDQVPRFNGNHLENLFETELAFHEVAEDLEFSSGEELFQNFRKCLAGTARTKFRTASEGKAQTPAGFKAALEEWKQKYMGPNARLIQIEYLQNLKKPKDMDVRCFYERIDVIVSYLSYIPSQADEKLSDHDVKRLFRNAMPTEWIKALTRAQPNLAAISLVDLVQFMSNEEQFGSIDSEASAMTKTSKKRTSDTQDQPHDASKASTDGNKSNKKPRVGPNDECPIHGNHKWGKCSLNNRSPNYQFQYNNNNNNNNNVHASAQHGNSSSTGHSWMPSSNSKSSGHGPPHSYNMDSLSYNMNPPTNSTPPHTANTTPQPNNYSGWGSLRNTW
jgi:hypothetical protein